MGNLIKVKAVKDESGHWYIIPNNEVDEFYELYGDEDRCGEMDEKFGGYRTGGGLNNIQLYVNAKELKEL